jgi:HlyD family secretion protein
MQNKLPKNKIILIAVIAIPVIIIILIIRSCSGTNDVEFEFAEASKGPVKYSITVSGKLEVLNTKRVLSKIDGIVNKVYVDFNQQVRKGQLLATLDSTKIDQEILRAQTKIEKAKLEKKIAEDTIAAKRSLYKDKLIARKEIQKAELDYKQAVFEFKQIQLEYKIFQRQKNYTRIVAPISGFVISREIEENVPITISKNLFTIAPTLKKMQLIINVEEADMGVIEKGQDVSFTVSAFTENKFYGKIGQVRIAPQQQKNIVVYESLVIADNKDLLLKPGMTATATIIVADKDNVLRVPNQAFIVSPVEMPKDDGKRYLWIRSNKLVAGVPAKIVEVKTGVRGDMYTEVLKGLKKGDEVLVNIIRGSSGN